MTTYEPEIQAGPERAVFVADDDRRSRRLRTGVIAAGAFAVLWASGLAIGTLGSGHLPGIARHIPGLGSDRGQAGGSNGNAPRPAQLAAERSAATRIAERSERVEIRQARAGSARNAAVAPTEARKPVGARTRRGVAPQPAASSLVAQPAPQATRQPVRPGLARRGLTAPPGQERKAATTTTPTPPGETRRIERPHAKPVAEPAATPMTQTLPPGPQNPDKPPPKG